MNWKRPEESLPQNPDTTVLVICTGDPEGGIRLRNSLQLATYSQQEGWIIEEYPNWENPTIRYWADIQMPQEIQDEILQYLKEGV